FDLEHRALARLVGPAGRLRDDAVETGSLETRQPQRRRLSIARHRRQVDGWFDPREQTLQTCPALALGGRPQVPPTDGERVERDERGRSFLREPGDTRSRRMKSKLQGVEVEPARR